MNSTTVDEKGGLGSVHLAVTLAANRLPFPFGVPGPLRARSAALAEARASPDASPEERVEYLRSVSLSWLLFGLVAGVAMVGLAWVGHAVAGNGGRTVGIAVGAGAGFFCLAGAAYSIWKLVWAMLARFRWRRYGIDDPRTQRTMDRATVRNSSLYGQALVGAAVFALVVAFL